MKRSIQGLFVLLLIVTMIGPINVAEAKPTKVSVGQTGSVVTAGNGSISLTYDLSTGRGSFKQGSTTLISNFYSDYQLYGTSSRIHSYDPGKRSAKWEAIGNDGYG
ncbi:hypothetical protein [Paenibacillus lignilyticus]|uniref:Uncharacterized protein n=1 Tax=Paenibacillus lignilyticus TaxID=1172615 RepID=A0ABS5CJ30_9BACL|nr:hypothetical protein [Paenibacillus lignilyticus]MBP3965897.1 hypothetical protein [Paenibacillus lignilyticus]